MNRQIKSILFLSANDFKEKSIQVIRKTPEAYAKAGWKVYYIVARDNSKYGDYFYEKEINPEGIYVYRFNYPFTKLRDFLKIHTIRTIVSKIAGFVIVFRLTYNGNKILRKNKIDVIYGFEVHGVLAVNLLKIFGKLKNIAIVSRFQGTFYYNYCKNKMYLKMLLNIDHYLALYLGSDLCIMTDDGTQGNKAMVSIKSVMFGLVVNG